MSAVSVGLQLSSIITDAYHSPGRHTDRASEQGRPSPGIPPKLPACNRAINELAIIHMHAERRPAVIPACSQGLAEYRAHPYQHKPHLGAGKAHNCPSEAQNPLVGRMFLECRRYPTRLVENAAVLADQSHSQRKSIRQPPVR